MSKIEEALEKANKLREFAVNKIEKPHIVREVNPGGYNNVATLTDPDSPIAEEFRRLKSMLIRETKTDFLNSIMVTSSIDGEGKSTVAVNLAISMAQELGHSIVLVDADHR